MFMIIQICMINMGCSIHQLLKLVFLQILNIVISSMLLRLKDVTLIFSKTLKKNTRKETTRLENELTRLIDSDSQDSEEKIRLIELEILQKELLEQQLILKFKENFTLLKDEHATKKKLNLESTKGGV
jgi:hypothetical protein